MREVFEEKSDSFSGSLESAKDFLSTTYMGEELSLGQVLEARAILDECLWREPGQDHLSLLGNPPTHQEIATKLKNAKNTSPGVEYRHLKKLDTSGLLESIFAAV